MVKQWEAESIAIQKKKAKLLRRRMLRRRAYGCLAVCVAAYAALAGWWLHHSGELERMQQALSTRAQNLVIASGLTVHHVRIEGQKQLSAQAILTQANVDPNALILSLSLSELQARIEQHPQIASASVTRSLPDRLLIEVTERQPAAIWQAGGKEVWLDKNGAHLNASLLTPDVKKARYPVITGQGADKALLSLWKLLQSAPELSQKLRGAQWVGNRRWTLWLTNNTKILLPMEQPKQAFEQLAQWQLEYGVLDRNIEQIDLRVEGMAYLRVGQGGVISPEADKRLLTVAQRGAI